MTERTGEQHGKIPELTGLRSIAVMFVVLGHAQSTLAHGYSGFLFPLRFFANGGLGVRIFFVLSGFLITSLLHQEYSRSHRIGLLRFYQRRALRIWPASYAYILVIALFAAAGSIAVSATQLAVAALHSWDYIAALGLARSTPANVDGWWYLGHFWSLALEEQFYWIWPPVLLLLLRRKNAWLLPALIMVVPAFRVACYFLTPGLRPQLGIMLHTAVDPILVGCLVALERNRLQKFLDRFRFSASVVTCAAIALVVLEGYWHGVSRRYWNASYGPTIEATIAGTLIVLLASRRGFWLSNVLRSPVALFIGTISYSIYLWQQLFLGENSPVALRFPLNIAAIVVAASASYWCIERPFLKLKEHWSAQAPREAGVTKRAVRHENQTA